MYTRFDTESRIAVAQATDIARELGHQEVGPGHLLLGLLANPRGTAYAALRDHGLDLDSAREIVATHHVEAEPEPQDAGDAGDGETRGYAEDREALEAIGIDLDRVREAVRANLGDDLAEGWADRPERGRGRGRGERRGRRHHHGHEHHRRGRRGPRSRREDGPRFSGELRALLRDVRRSVLRDRLDSDDHDTARRVPGMTGARLLVAITRSDDVAAHAVLATADSLDGLRAQAEAAVEQPRA
jgi:Clp amino terminal domain, pathogenicity island component